MEVSELRKERENIIAVFQIAPWFSIPFSSGFFPRVLRHHPRPPPAAVGIIEFSSRVFFLLLRLLLLLLPGWWLVACNKKINQRSLPGLIWNSLWRRRGDCNLHPALIKWVIIEISYSPPLLRWLFLLLVYELLVGSNPFEWLGEIILAKGLGFIVKVNVNFSDSGLLRNSLISIIFLGQRIHSSYSQRPIASDLQ